MSTLLTTNFNFPGQTKVYKGKVRDVYTLENDLTSVVTTGVTSDQNFV